MDSNGLMQFAGAVASGAVRVVDLTFTLSPDFPVIVLPPEFGQAAPVRIQQISRYDGAGPAWYWNNLTFGEHTGTHFDAPIHWFTGKDLPNNSVDTLPVRDMIAPACVIDCSAQAAKDADFLLTIPVIEAWEKSHGRIPERHWVLLRTDWSKKGWRDYANLKDDGAHTPGPDAAVMRWLVEERGIIGLGTETIGTDAGRAGHLDRRAERQGIGCRPGVCRRNRWRESPCHPARRRLGPGRVDAQRAQAGRAGKGRFPDRHVRRTADAGDGHGCDRNEGADGGGLADRAGPGRGGRAMGGANATADAASRSGHRRSHEEPQREDGGVHRLLRCLRRPDVQFAAASR